MWLCAILRVRNMKHKMPYATLHRGMLGGLGKIFLGETVCLESWEGFVRLFELEMDRRLPCGNVSNIVGREMTILRVGPLFH